MMRWPFPAWTLAIAVILILQTTSAYLTRIVPIVSPAFMKEFGWNGSGIGYLTVANTVGALFVLMIGTALIRQVGAVRALQVSLLIGAASIVLFYFPSFAVALFASFLIGLSNGTATPAGSEVLQRFTPAANRNFVFSIKQAGVPLGGVIAGLTLPPLVDALGWRMALVVSAAAAIGGTCVMWPFCARIDGPRIWASALKLDGLSSMRDLAFPVRSLSLAPGLLRIALVGALLAIAQAVWFTFTVTYLVVELGISLSVAGLVFAVMQGTSVVGRVLMGWITDRPGSAQTTLAAAAVASAVTTALLAMSTAAWPVWSLVLLAAVAGVAVASWNGVQVAEVARRSPPGLVGETASGSVILVFISHMVAPAAFAAFVAATNRYDYALLVAAGCSLLCLPLLKGIDRSAEKLR